MSFPLISEENVLSFYDCISSLKPCRENDSSIIQLYGIYFQFISDHITCIPPKIIIEQATNMLSEIEKLGSEVYVDCAKWSRDDVVKVRGLCTGIRQRAWFRTIEVNITHDNPPLITRGDPVTIQHRDNSLIQSLD